jgi:hypothetical protein
MSSWMLRAPSKTSRPTLAAVNCLATDATYKTDNGVKGAPNGSAAPKDATRRGGRRRRRQPQCLAGGGPDLRMVTSPVPTALVGAPCP